MNSTETTRSPSSSVDDYLKALWEVSGTGVASTKEIAHRLSVSSASVTGMLKRLREMDLVEYERYHGASLTEAGCVEALRLVRRHRLIETFLREHLGYSWQDVHKEAESLENAVSDAFTERLADLLDHPTHDPHGDPIPAADGSLARDESWPLSEAKPHQRVSISRVRNDEDPTLIYLGERRLVPGRVLEVKEVRALDGVVVIEDEDGGEYFLGSPLASSIFVESSSKMES